MFCESSTLQNIFPQNININIKRERASLRRQQQPIYQRVTRAHSLTFCTQQRWLGGGLLLQTTHCVQISEKGIKTVWNRGNGCHGDARRVTCISFLWSNSASESEERAEILAGGRRFRWRGAGNFCTSRRESNLRVCEQKALSQMAQLVFLLGAGW